jgi:FkbM family methyltransferase
VRQIVSTLEALCPRKAKELLLGSPSHPSWFANSVHMVLNQLPGDRVACFPCHSQLQGYRMKIDWQRHRSFLAGTWEPAVVNAVTKVVKPGSYAVDIGAHIGFYTLLLAKLVGRRGRVLAFEPLPWNFSVLAENIKINDCKQVNLINKAVLDRRCELTANMYNEGPLPGSVSFSTADQMDLTRVEAVSLDDILQNDGQAVEFLKVDVEGAELLVLKGAARTIEKNHPAIVIEVHHFESSPDDSPVILQLSEWGYRTRWLDRGQLTSHLLAH